MQDSAWQKHLGSQLATPSPQARVLLAFETCLAPLSLMVWTKHRHIPVVVWSVWYKMLYAPTPSHTPRSSINTLDYSNKAELFLRGIPPSLVLESILSLSFPCSFSFSFSIRALPTSPSPSLPGLRPWGVVNQMAGAIWELAVPRNCELWSKGGRTSERLQCW